MGIKDFQRELINGLTVMKKIAAMALPITALMHAGAYGGTTELIATPNTPEKMISMYVECGSEDWVYQGVCGVEINDTSFNNSGYMGQSGVCEGTVPAIPAIMLGGWAGEKMVGCANAGSSTDKRNIRIWGTYHFYLKNLPDDFYKTGAMRVRARGVTHGSRTNLRLRAILPDGQIINETLESDSGEVNGRWFTVQHRAWLGDRTTTSISIRYPDYVTLRRGEKITLMESDGPVFVKAETDLKGIVVTNELGLDLVSTGQQLISKRLVMGEAGADVGVQQGTVRLSVNVQ